MLFKFLVFIAFSILLTHNFTPHQHHYHHHEALQGSQPHQHQHHDDHDPDDQPVNSHQVDEVFTYKIYCLKLALHSMIEDFVSLPSISWNLMIANTTGDIFYTPGHPPLQFQISANSFRGPPYQ